MIDLIRLLWPLSEDQKKALADASTCLEEEEKRQLKYLFKTKKLVLNYTRIGYSGKLMEDIFYPQAKAIDDDESVKEFAEKFNRTHAEYHTHKAFKKFSEIAKQKILEYIAPNIFGLEHVKKAAMLQLFCPEIIHILLLGDPGTGKSKILKSVSDLHSPSVFGLGSGISGAGLGLTVKGDKVIEGLLPKANGGLCCIDELNLVNKAEYGYLYSAMEEGFVAYDKANSHVRLDAKIRVLAAANPAGDKFVGRMLDTLQKQIPFQSALLSRFHLIFIIRRLDVEGFVHVAKKIVTNDSIHLPKEDINFIKRYVDHCETFDVKFPKDLEGEVMVFAERIKNREAEYIFEITPRAIVGMVRLCKASARLHMRKAVTKEDIAEVTNLIEEAFRVRDK
jgi:DNA replicative helicase MCM subunit Mcm2 (Cdc46/Mcm family)